MIASGQPAPPFDLVDQHRNHVTLDDLAGRPALVVFMPFAFTRVCGSEMCDLRNNQAHLEAVDAGVVVITCDTAATNRAWAESEGFGFTILSDFWPHGEVTRAYGTFNEALGVAHRTSFVLDRGGIVRAVISTGSLREPRPFNSYTDALAAL
ncbi:peroxiredoxin AhpE [soil metagenome]